jgi:hypothetical protein
MPSRPSCRQKDRGVVPVGMIAEKMPIRRLPAAGPKRRRRAQDQTSRFNPNGTHRAPRCCDRRPPQAKRLWNPPPRSQRMNVIAFSSRPSRTTPSTCWTRPASCRAGTRVQSVLRDTFRAKLSASTSRGFIPRKTERTDFRKGHCELRGWRARERRLARAQRWRMLLGGSRH